MIQRRKLPRQKILRYPRLDTVLMVERFIKRHSQEFTKYQIWKRLPKKMMYQTFQIVIDYLENGGKIMVCDDGIIIWTYNPRRIKELFRKGLVVR